MEQRDVVINLDKLEDVDDCKQARRPVFSCGPMMAIRALVMTFFGYGNDGGLPRSVDLRDR